MGDSSEDERETDETASELSRANTPMPPATPLPVLKATGEQEEKVSQKPAMVSVVSESKPRTPDQPKTQPIDNGLVVLKLANGVIRKGHKPSRSPEPCYINRLCSMPSLVNMDDPQKAS